MLCRRAIPARNCGRLDLLATLETLAYKPTRNISAISVPGRKRPAISRFQKAHLAAISEGTQAWP
jgi:hypothetical protein